MPRSAREIVVFLILTVTFSSVFWALAIATGNVSGGAGAYAVGLMWCPGVAALATCALFRRRISILGWSWGRTRYQVLAYLVPLGYTAAAYCTIWATGLGGFPDMAFVEKMRQSLGWPGAPVWLVIAGWFALLGTTVVVRGVASALGEEIGWRGFLAPALTERYGFTAGALATGAIWAAWHFPILLFSSYNNGTPWWFALPCFTVGVVSISVVMSWFRLKSNSLWTAAILHSSHNAFVQAYFTPLTTSRGSITAFAVDEFGFVLPLIIAAAAASFWMIRYEASPPPIATPSMPDEE